MFPHRPASISRIRSHHCPITPPTSSLRSGGHCKFLCLTVSLSHPAWSSTNFRRLLSCTPRWPRGHRVLCFSDPLPQNGKIAGNVYLSLSIQEITCKETKRPASADTIIPAPSNTSWFRPRREGPYSMSELLHFLPHRAAGSGGGGGRMDGRQVITSWRGNSEEREEKKTLVLGG